MRLLFSIFLLLGCWIPVAHGHLLLNRLFYFILPPSFTVSFATLNDEFERLFSVEDGKVYDLAQHNITALTYRVDLSGFVSGNLEKVSFEYKFSNVQNQTFGMAVVDPDEPFVLSEGGSSYFSRPGMHTLTANALDSDLVSIGSTTISWELIDSSTD
jgi:hypothetical protein